MQYIPFMVVAAGLLGCLVILIAGLTMSFRMGGWGAMMQLPPEGNWSRARRFVYIGAIGFVVFNCLFTILTWIPGTLPWRSGPTTHPSLGGSATRAAQSDEQDAPDFDPKLSLDWPGVPNESRKRIDQGSDDETTIYSASVSLTGPVTIFSATVYEFSEQALRDSDPNEALVGSSTNADEEELSRKPVRLGPEKYAGFDVTAKSGDGLVRRMTVSAGTRLYTISACSTAVDRLSAQDVTAFFDSFAIKP